MSDGKTPSAPQVVNWNADGLVGPCARCGELPVRLDYTVEDDFWRRVVPDRFRLDVLCFGCLDDLAGGVPLDQVKVAYLTGSCGTLPLVPARRTNDEDQPLRRR